MAPVEGGVPGALDHAVLAAPNGSGEHRIEPLLALDLRAQRDSGVPWDTAT
jgi:hypothetical protein